jgi:hypothetical protein
LHAELMQKRGIYYRLYQLQCAVEEGAKSEVEDTAAKV